jgi:hypothetical protein
VSSFGTILEQLRQLLVLIKSHNGISLPDKLILALLLIVCCVGYSQAINLNAV